MKKFLKVLFISLFTLTFVSACSIIKLSPEKFKSIMEEEQYEVASPPSILETNTIETYNVAKNKEQDIQVEFYTFKSTKYAKSFFEETKSNMKIEELYVSSDSNAINWINYSSYITRTNNTYKRVIKKYNTIVVIETTAVNTSKATYIAKQLGY